MTVSQMSETETTSSPQQKQEWLAEPTLYAETDKNGRFVIVGVAAPSRCVLQARSILQGVKGIREDNVIRLRERNCSESCDRFLERVPI